MRVFLRGGQTGMAQQLLNRPQIRSAFQKVGGKGMPDRMRGNPARKVSPLDIFFYNFTHSPGGDSSPPMIQEQFVRAGAKIPDFIDF